MNLTVEDTDDGVRPDLYSNFDLDFVTREIYLPSKPLEMSSLDLGREGNIPQTLFSDTCMEEAGLTLTDRALTFSLDVHKHKFRRDGLQFCLSSPLRM